MALFPLGILSAAGGEVAGPAYELIETSIVSGSSTSSVVFSSLGTYSSTYKHLQIRILGRTSTTSAEGRVRINSTLPVYRHVLLGNGSSVSSVANANNGLIAPFTQSTDTANAFGASVIDILDPYSTTKNKTVRVLNGVPSIIHLFSALYEFTTAVSTIEIDTTAGNFVAGSRFSLYGIKG
jgi:hypothetical protein